MGTVPEPKKEPPALEEFTYRRGDLDLRFLMNRAHHHVRVLDYRIGNYHEKRDLLDRMAQKEGLRKVFTLVEKPDSQSWRAVGFSKEGVLPGFFRTADGYVMTRLYEGGEPIVGGATKVPAEKLPVVAPRRIRRPEGARVQIVTESARLSAIGGSPADLRFIPMGRAGLVPDLAVEIRHRKDVRWIMAELDESFGHARVDLFPAARATIETPLWSWGMQTLIAQLVERAVVNVFSLAAMDDAVMTDLVLGMGFKVTARLADHLCLDGAFHHALFWHRRIAGQAAG
jgi:hypothetical protein